MAERAIHNIQLFDLTEEEVARAAKSVGREADADVLLDMLGLV